MDINSWTIDCINDVAVMTSPIGWWTINLKLYCLHFGRRHLVFLEPEASLHELKPIFMGKEMSVTPWIIYF